MSPLSERLRQVASDLQQIGHPAAVVGGLAVSVRSEPRFTRDIDLVVAVADDREAETAVTNWMSRDYRLLAQIEQESANRLATVRLAMPGQEQTTVPDLLFASSGIEPEIVAAAEQLEVLPGIVLPVAQVGHLIATKLLSRDDRSRPQDAGDLRGLLEIAEESELQRAREAVRLIVQRGFARERDLPNALEQLLADR